MEFTMMLPMGGVEGLLGIAGRSGSKEVAMAITRSLSFNGSKGLGITGERALFQVMRKEGMDLGMTVAESESYAKGISSLITNEGTMSMRQTQFAFKFARRYPKTVSILQNIQSSKIYTGVKDKALYLKSLRDSYKNLITEIEDFGYKKLSEGLPNIEQKELANANRLARKIWSYRNKSYKEVLKESGKNSIPNLNNPNSLSNQTIQNQTKNEIVDEWFDEYDSYMERINQGYNGIDPVRITPFIEWMSSQPIFEEEITRQKTAEIWKQQMDENNKTYQITSRQSKDWETYGASLKQYNDLPNKQVDGTWKPSFNEWYTKEMKLWNYWKLNGSFPLPIPIPIPIIQPIIQPITQPNLIQQPTRQIPRTYTHVDRPQHESMFYSFDHQPQINQNWLEYGQKQVRTNPSTINNIQLQNFFNGNQQSHEAQQSATPAPIQVHMDTPQQST
jgi:hypothetical protein